MAVEYVPPNYGRVLPPIAKRQAARLNEGVGIVFKVWSEETGNALAIVEHPIRPETLAAPVHVHHQEDEISYVLEGEVALQLGEQVLSAPQGTMLFKPRGIPHTFWNPTKRSARLLQIFTPGGFERYFQEAEEGGVALLGELAEKYHLEVEPESVARLAQQYGLKFPKRALAA